tara:strand:+ start:1350 stop:1790 length:441 start_codon:yes stop_codon:yes gene_type:complete
MNKHTSTWIRKNCHGKDVRLSSDLRKLDPIQEKIIFNLSMIESLHFIKVKSNAILVSSEVEGFYKKPITKPGHSSAIGLWIELNYKFKILEFVEINSPIKGYGQRMVNAVLSDFPLDWQATIIFDYSYGFWGWIKEKHTSVQWLEM